jgi:hypothetical protein
MMSTEQLRKRGRSLVADTGRNPCNSLVACFEQKRGLRHPARDQIAVHGLADELSEASRKRRPTKSHALPEVAKRPGAIRPLVDQLKCRSYVWVCHGPQPSAFSGAERLDPASQHLDEEHFSQT